jgi:hypothetical protein
MSHPIEQSIVRLAPRGVIRAHVAAARREVGGATAVAGTCPRLQVVRPVWALGSHGRVRKCLTADRDPREQSSEFG